MQERDIFIAAMPKNAAERTAYLAEACGDDRDLRLRVEQLLVEHEKEQSFFLDAPLPIVRMTIDQPFQEKLGTRIGPYRLLQQIGEGGMGVVFMAEQTEPIARLVALKIIKPGMDTQQVIARFEAERQALAMMDHVNIARVLDAGATEQGRPYFVMELVHGVPITKYCDDNRLSPRQRLELFVPVCQAIQHAHQKGIIHRDIKPSNVMVTLYDGKPVPKVIDFGVAKAIEQKLTARTLFTQYGTMVGTLEYMSPEQAELSGLGVDTRSDIYSLGVLLYELLTGSTPLSHQRVKEAAYAEIVRLIREEDPPKPSRRLSDSGAALASISAQRHTEPAKLSKLMRGELDWIVMKTLEKDRNRRYETANGFAQDVQRYLNNEPVQACPPSTAYRFRKFARRNKTALATGVIVSAALVIAVVVLAASNLIITAERNAKGEALTQKVHALGEKQLALVQKEAALQQAQTNYLEAKRQEGLAKQQERIATEQTLLARRRLYASQMNLAMQAWRGGEIPRVLELLEGQRPQTGEVDLRGFEWFYLWRKCNIGRLHLDGHTDAVLGVAYSPDGQTLASASSDGTIRLWSSATGRERMVLRGHASAPWNVTFSPDGTLLASGGKATSDVILWDATTGTQIYTISATVNGLAFSPDGKMLLGGGSSTRLWDVVTGKEIAHDPEPSFMIGMLGDGTTVVTLKGLHTQRAEVQSWHVKDGTRQVTIPLPEAVTAAISPDGAWLATSSGWAVKLWDVTTGKLKSQYSAQSSARGLAFSPDGKRLAAGYEDRRVIVWDVESGAQLGEDVHRDVVWAVAYSPNSQTIASATLGGAINLWDLRPPEEVNSIPIERVADLRFSDDGRTLLLATPGLTSVVDVSAAVEMAVMPLSGVSVISASGERAAWLSSDHKAVVGDLSSGREAARLPVRTATDGRLAVALSPDGARAAIFVSWDGDEKVVLWDVETQTERTLISDVRGLGVNCAHFSPDGRFLAIGFHFQWVVVWDLATQTVKRQFAQQPNMMEILSLSFSPDSKALAVGTNIGAVTLWDVETGERIAAFRGHTSRVNALAFSPDGEMLVTAGADKTLKLWDARTGQERSTLTGHTGTISHVQFSPDGHTLVSASPGSVKFWRAGTDPVTHTTGDADAVQSSHTTPARTSTSLALPAGAIALTETGLREALSRWPEEVELHRRLGRLLNAQEKLAEAASSFQEVVRLKPDDTAYGSLAEVLRKQRKLAEAESALREAIRLKPSWPWRYVALGSLLQQQAKYSEAELAFGEAIRLKPDLPDAHYGLGLVLLEQKKFDEALLPMRAASRFSPTNPHIRGYLGSVLLNLGQAAEAEVEFRERIRLAPQEPEGHVQLGRSLSRQKKLSQAIVPLREALRLKPTHPSAHEVLGWAYMGQELFSEAESAFREQTRVSPTSPSGHYGLGEALQKQKRSGDAVAPLREAVRLQPDNYGPRDMLAWALLLTGAPAEAELEFRELTHLKPDLVSGHVGLGRALVEQEKFAEAETALREALRIAPEHLGVPQLLGRAFAGQGKTAEAAELLQKTAAQKAREREQP